MTITDTPRPTKGRKAKTEPRRAAKSKDRKVDPARQEVTWDSPVRPKLIFLPPKIRDAQAHRKAVQRSIVMSMVMLLAAGGGYFVTTAQVALEDQRLAVEEERTAALAAEIAENRPIEDYLNGLIERKTMVSDALANDLSHHRIVGAILTANTVGATFNSITRADPNEGVTCESGNPFIESAAIGCMVIEGQAPSIAQAAEFASALEGAQGILTDAYVTGSGTSDSEEGAAFRIVVGYTTEALSYKGDAFQPTEEELASVLKTDDATSATTEGVTQ